MRFISLICLLMAMVHIKNTFFTPQNPGFISPLPKLLSPKAANLSPSQSNKDQLNNEQNTNQLKSIGLNSNPSKELIEDLKNEQDLKDSNHDFNKNIEKAPTKVTKISLKKITSPDKISDHQNSFQKTYKKFAILEFNKNTRKQFELDLKEMPKNFLSMGFTVDQGSIKQPKVEVKYTNGSIETLKLPFNEMFQDDWVKLDTNPNLKIESLNVSALSPVDKSIFSFFIQEHL